MENYRIIRVSWADERGKEEQTSFYIEYKCSFLFFKWWKVVSHKEYGYRGFYNIPTKFKDMYSANQFITKIMKSGMPKQKWFTYVVKNIN